jgi:hypothetical protein
MSELLLVTSGWPIAILSPPAVLDGTWLTQLDTHVKACFARRERYAVITDLRPLKAFPDARERRALAAWAGRPEQAELQKRWNVCSSTIVRNALVRGGLQALFWLWTPATPQHVAGDLDEAWAWCVRELERQARPLPAPAETLRVAAFAELARRRGVGVGSLGSDAV